MSSGTGGGTYGQQAVKLYWQQVAVPQTLEEERDHLRGQLAALNKELQRLAEEPALPGVLVGLTDKHMTVRIGDNAITTTRPAGIELKVGGFVLTRMQGGGVIGPVEVPTGCGMLYDIAAVRENNTYEVSGAGPGVMVVLSALDGPMKVGDRVLLDQARVTIVANAGKAKSVMAFGEKTGVSWDDVRGQKEAKRALREAIEDPYINRDAYKKFGKKPTKGVLLYGPPGNGKTMLAKAAATALADLHGASSREGGFIYVKGPEVLNMWQGASEAGVRKMFSSARTHMEVHGYPAIICVDEADALVGKRGAGRFEGAERTIVPQFLAEMDGLSESGAFVLLLTNRPDALDPAVMRDGRVDRRVEVGAPTKEDFADIVEGALSGKLLHESETASYLAQMAAEDVYGGKHGLFRLLSKSKPPFEVTLGNFASGAMAVGVAERATQLALRRYLAKEQPEGITSYDVVEAVATSSLEARCSDPSGVLVPMAKAMGDDFTGVEPIAVS